MATKTKTSCVKPAMTISAFRKLGRFRKAVVIAQDVIAQIEAERLVAKTGYSITNSLRN